MTPPATGHFTLSVHPAMGALLWAMGIGPRRRGVDVSDDVVEVRMGWGFRARLDRTAVLAAGADHTPVRAWGAHGWRGEWLVNGSSRGLVRLDLHPAQPGRVLGVPVRVRRLRVSLDDPVGFLAALAH